MLVKLFHRFRHGCLFCGITRDGSRTTNILPESGKFKRKWRTRGKILGFLKFVFQYLSHLKPLSWIFSPLLKACWMFGNFGTESETCWNLGFQNEIPCLPMFGRSLDVDECGFERVGRVGTGDRFLHDRTEAKLTDFVEIKRIISRHGAIQSRLKKGSPSVTELVRSALVVLADSRDSRVHLLTAVHVLDRGFAEEEEYVVVVSHGIHEARTWNGSLSDVIKKKKLSDWTTR